jgi:hypothetical protein
MQLGALVRRAALACALALWVGPLAAQTASTPAVQAASPDVQPDPAAAATPATAGGEAAVAGIPAGAEAETTPSLAAPASTAAANPPDPKAARKPGPEGQGQADGEARNAPLEPRHLKAGKGWSGSQFLQADKKGRLFLLRAATLDVHPLSSDGALGEAKHLSNGDSPASGECSLSGPVPEVTGQCLVLTAAMSRGGDWAVQDGLYARIFRGRKEEPAEKPGIVISGLAFQDDDPVIAGYPNAADYALARHEKLPDTLAALSRWSAGKWETLSSSAVAPKDGMRGLWEQHMLLLAGTADGHLWAGSLYQHRFREYSRAGKLLTQILVGDGAIRRAPNAEARQKASDEIAREISKGKLQVSITEMTGEPVTLALTEGTDGRMYFLVRDAGDGAGGVYLERYEAASGTFERLPIELAGAARGTMAASKDGLFIAPMPAEQGVWAFSWDQLRDAKWAPVEAKIGSGASGGTGDAPARAAKSVSNPHPRERSAPAGAAAAMPAPG